jgi:hypothetical protein
MKFHAAKEAASWSVVKCNCRQMDLSGPGIDVKLKERRKKE